PAAEPAAPAAAAAPSPAAPAPAAAAPAAPAPATPDAATPGPAPSPDAAPASDDLVAKAQADAKAWLEPIGDPPHGADARYEPEYESLRVEVAKLDAPAGDEVQWDQVGKLADGIIKERSKDLLAAAYFAFAKLDAEGVAGLCVGLSVITGMFDQFEELWPKRPRGRGNALSWLTEQLERKLGDVKPQPKDRPQIEALQKIVKSFGAQSRASLEDHAPSVRPLETRVQRLLLSIPKPEAKAPPPAAPTPAATPSPQQPAAPRPAAAAPAAPMPATADVGSAEEVKKFLLETGRSMIKAGNLLRNAKLSDPTAYRLVRAGVWLHLSSAPPAAAGGKTQIPPMPPQRRQQLDLIASNGKWPALLGETEAALVQFRFNLDLNRLSATALQRLGDEYEPARQALLGEVGALLRRMPSLPDLTAGNGTPLADDETRAWIESDVATAGGGGGGGGAGGRAEGPGEEFGKLSGLIKAGKAAEAMKMAKKAIDGTGSPRLRLIRRMALAQSCLESGQPKLARSMFAAAEHEIRERGLMEWEPQLASQCLEGLVRAIRAAAQKGSPYPAADSVYERLCHVDPTAAAKFT
ncbi:MAG: type VI secretion system protein TssA, partial [Deltaproteobacteria bacterium]|nr:type VI secretion system protein TssA [Deltaproteobacteria bacterium]